MPGNSFGTLLRNKATVVLAYLVAIGLSAYAGYDIYQRYQTMHQLESRMTTAMQPVDAATRDIKKVKDTRRVAAMYLFGKQESRTKPKPQVVDAPVTRLKLTLIGTVAGNVPTDSKAVVQIDNKQVMIFKVGDTIPKTNAKIHQIQTTQILLMRNGKLERLAINRPELNSSEGKDRQILINSKSRAGVDNLLTPTEVLRSSSKRQREYNARQAAPRAKQ